MKKYIILIPFHNPWEWHTDYANQTAVILSRTHIVVCFLWGDAVSLWELIRGAKSYRPLVHHGSVWKIQPLFIFPGKRFFTIQLVNIFLNSIFVHILCSCIAVWQPRTKLFWFFGYYDPAFLLLPPFFRQWKTVYDCVDIATHPNTKLARHIHESEAHLLDYAWVVFANSHTLTEKIRPKRPDVYTVPLGFRMDMFRHPQNHPLNYRGRQPIIGYIGSIDYRLNISLIYSLAMRHPKWQFALIGPIFYDHFSVKKQQILSRILTRPNVIYEQVGQEAIPSILSQFSVAIIPFDMTIPLSRYAYPMKVMEYFYAQKPVVSAPIDELLQFTPLLHFARNQKEWEREIRMAIARPMSKTRRIMSREIAVRNTWEQKLNAILKFMSAV